MDCSANLKLMYSQTKRFANCPGGQNCLRIREFIIFPLGKMGLKNQKKLNPKPIPENAVVALILDLL